MAMGMTTPKEESSTVMWVNTACSCHRACHLARTHQMLVLNAGEVSGQIREIDSGRMETKDHRDRQKSTPLLSPLRLQENTVLSKTPGKPKVSLTSDRRYRNLHILWERIQKP